MKRTWTQKLVSNLEMSRSWINGPTYSDMPFAFVDGRELCLDLYLPFSRPHPPLVLYLHGGGWQTGTYKEAGARWLTGYGFAVASVPYRLTGEARFPSQIHDVYAAIRWLRAHAPLYGYSARKLAILGVSSGGHLAMLAGANTGMPELEGRLGQHLDQPVTVDAVVNYFGASDLLLRSQSQPEQTDPPHSIVHRLLGSTPTQNPSLAQLASPAFQVTSRSAPLLVIHGEKDPQVLIDQAHRIVDSYQNAARPVSFLPIPDAGHGGPQFSSPSLHQKVTAFLHEHLKSVPPPQLA